MLYFLIFLLPFFSQPPLMAHDTSHFKPLQLADAEQKEVALTLAKKGAVRVYRSQGTSTELDIGQVLYLGDTLETSASSFITLALPQTTLTIAGKASVTLDEAFLFPPKASSWTQVIEEMLDFLAGKCTPGNLPGNTETDTVTVGIRA